MMVWPLQWRPCFVVHLICYHPWKWGSVIDSFVMMTRRCLRQLFLRVLSSSSPYIVRLQVGWGTWQAPDICSNGLFESVEPTFKRVVMSICPPWSPLLCRRNESSDSLAEFTLWGGFDQPVDAEDEHHKHWEQLNHPTEGLEQLHDNLSLANWQLCWGRWPVTYNHGNDDYDVNTVFNKGQNDNWGNHMFASQDDDDEDACGPGG